MCVVHLSYSISVRWKVIYLKSKSSAVEINYPVRLALSIHKITQDQKYVIDGDDKIYRTYSTAENATEIILPFFKMLGSLSIQIFLCIGKFYVLSQKASVLVFRQCFCFSKYFCKGKYLAIFGGFFCWAYDTGYVVVLVLCNTINNLR